MESNDELLKRLARMTEGHDGMIRELKAGVEELRFFRKEQAGLNKTLIAMLSGQAEEIRDIKAMSKDMKRLLEQHERTQRLHWRFIHDFKNRGR